MLDLFGLLSCLLKQACWDFGLYSYLWILVWMEDSERSRLVETSMVQCFMRRTGKCPPWMVRASLTFQATEYSERHACFAAGASSAESQSATSSPFLCPASQLATSLCPSSPLPLGELPPQPSILSISRPHSSFSQGSYSSTSQPSAAPQAPPCPQSTAAITWT